MMSWILSGLLNNNVGEHNSNPLYDGNYILRIRPEHVQRAQLSEQVAQTPRPLTPVVLMSL